MSESHDPWESARAAAREDVHRVFAARTQRCATCGRTTETSAAVCPHCRSPYAFRERDFRLTRKRLAIVAAILAALGVAVALIVPGLQEDAATERRAAAAAQERLEAAETARLRREVQPVRAQGPAREAGETAITHRVRLVGAGEAAIAADARERAAAGRLDGPVRGAHCRPYPKTDTRKLQEADPDIPANRYECIAYQRTYPLPELQGKQRTGYLGHPYWLVVDYRTAEMAWCRLAPRAGEGGVALATVTTPDACLDPLD